MYFPAPSFVMMKASFSFLSDLSELNHAATRERPVLRRSAMEAESSRCFFSRCGTRLLAMKDSAIAVMLSTSRPLR